MVILLLNIRFCLPKALGDPWIALTVSFFPCGDLSDLLGADLLCQLYFQKNIIHKIVHIIKLNKYIIVYLESLVLEFPDCFMVTWLQCICPAALPPITWMEWVDFGCNSFFAWLVLLSLVSETDFNPIALVF